MRRQKKNKNEEYNHHLFCFQSLVRICFSFNQHIFCIVCLIHNNDVTDEKEMLHNIKKCEIILS